MLDKRQNNLDKEDIKKLIKEAITEVRYKDFDLKVKEKRFEVRDTLIKLLFNLLVMLGLAVSIYSFYDVKNPQPQNHIKQIEQLNQMSQNLKDFQLFLDSQKEKISSEQLILLDLQKQKNEIEPIVKQNKKVVEAILSNYENRQNSSKKWDILLNVGIGVLGSYLASLLYEKLNMNKLINNLFKRKKSIDGNELQNTSEQ